MRVAYKCFGVLVLALAFQSGTAAHAQLMEVGKASLEHVEGATTVNTAEAKKLYDDGAYFIDVRSTMMWDGGHIPESVLIPIEKFTQENLAEITDQKDDPLVIYCQGIRCVRSAKACQKALSWGYSNVYYYREGFPDWKKSGLEVE